MRADVFEIGYYIAVAERCGFTQEAHLREKGRTNEGEAVDLQTYGLLRSEYLLSKPVEAQGPA